MLSATLPTAFCYSPLLLDSRSCSAMYSGDFYRQILPVMYDASIIDQERFLALMVCLNRCSPIIRTA